MGVRTGSEFEIQEIVSTEYKVVGGTAKRWTYHGDQRQTLQFDDDWQRAWRPKIGGWLVGMYDPHNPNRPAWIEYETPTKHAKRVAQLAKRTSKKEGIFIQSGRVKR